MGLMIEVHLDCPNCRTRDDFTYEEPAIEKSIIECNVCFTRFEFTEINFRLKDIDKDCFQTNLFH